LIGPIQASKPDLTPVAVVPYDPSEASSPPPARAAERRPRQAAILRAPAAASIALGAEINALGPVHEEPVVLRTPEPRRTDNGTMEGEVIHVDRFGNAITNLISRRGGVLDVAGISIQIHSTYADVDRGEPVALTGSNGFIEIAVREGNAATLLALTRGHKVSLRL